MCEEKIRLLLYNKYNHGKYAKKGENVIYLLLNYYFYYCALSFPIYLTDARCFCISRSQAAMASYFFGFSFVMHVGMESTMASPFKL
jgi:hypothetical protein